MTEQLLTPKEELIRKLETSDIILSYSSFNSFRKSPKHFIDYKLRKKKPTKDMDFGSMGHKLILEPDEFGNEYVVNTCSLTPSSPQQNKFCDLILGGENYFEAYQKSYKQLKDQSKNIEKATKLWDDLASYIEFMQSVNGRSIIEEKEYNLARKMQKAIFENQASRNILNQITQTELNIEWNLFGYDWRGYIDGIGDAVLDLKFVADADPRKVQRKIYYEFRYDWQAALYTCDEYSNLDYYVIAVDKGCNVSVHRIGKTEIYKAMNEIEWYIGKFNECIFLNEWDKSFDFYAPDNGVYEFGLF